MSDLMEVIKNEVDEATRRLANAVGPMSMIISCQLVLDMANEIKDLDLKLEQARVNDGALQRLIVRAKELEGLLEEERKRFKVISHSLINDLEIKLESQDAKLKHAYCGVVGADSIVGLDCCDDYKDWIKSLKG